MEQEDNKLVEERREKLKALRATGAAYPNDFRRRDLAAKLVESHGGKTKEELEKNSVNACIAGRMMLKRVMGKASFATPPDGPRKIANYGSHYLPRREKNFIFPKPPRTGAERRLP